MRADDPNSAVVFDFLADLVEDREAGRVRSLAEYLPRYPGYEEAITEAFERSQAEEEELAGAPGDPDEHRVGPYRLIEELGRGGQGSVWRAEDTRIQRTVAVKLLVGFLITDELRARLRREAESVARLAHPGICPVLEAEIEGEVPYLAMPLLEGHDLAHALREGWAPADRAGLERVLTFFEGAAQALQAAHEAGLVHRDIKPGNVFVTPDGAPVLLDFGLARDLDDDSHALTRSGELCGTPSYMSPEQLRGTSSGLDRRTDVYSLGATLFEGLTGSRPFEGATYFELERAIRLDPAPDARALNPTLPKDLAVVLSTALDKDPDRRYATAADLAEDLRRVRAHEPVRARPLGWTLRLVRWAQRQPAVAAASMTTFLALVIGLGVALSMLREVMEANEQVMQSNRRLEGRGFARRAADETDASPTLALLLGIEAARALGNSEGRSALYGPLFTCQLERAMDMEGAARCMATKVAGGSVVSLFTMPVRDPEGLFTGLTGRLAVFDLATGDLTWTFDLPTPMEHLDLHPSGDVAVVGTRAGEVLCLELVDHEVLCRVRVGAEDEAVRCVEFAGDARTFVALTGEHLVRMKFPRGEMLRTLPLPNGSLDHVAHGSDDDYLLLSPRPKLGLPAHASSVWLLERGPGDWRELPGDAPLPARLMDTLASVVAGSLTAATDRLVSPLSAAARGDDTGPSIRRRLADFSALVSRRVVAAVGEGLSPAPVRWAEWAPDHGSVVVADAAGGVRLLTRDGTVVGRYIAPATPTTARLSPDGSWLALASEAGDVVVHEVASGAVVAHFHHSGVVFRLAWSSDGKRLASTGADTTTRVFGLDPPRQLALGRGSQRPVDLCWDPRGTHVLTWNLGSRIQLWRAGPMPYAYRLGAPSGVTAAGLTEDGAWTLSGGTLRRFVIEREGLHHRLTGVQQVLSLGTERVGVGNDRVLWIDPVTEQVKTCALDGTEHTGDEIPDATNLVVGPKGRAALVVGEDGLNLVDAGTGRTRWTRAGAYGRVAFSPDGERLVACSAQQPAEVLDVQDGRVIRELPLFARDASWSVDGAELAVVEHTELVLKGHLHLFDREGVPLGSSHEFQYGRVTWSPRGDALLGWSENFSLALYRREGEGLKLLRPDILPRNGLTSVAFHPSGRWFAGSTSARKAPGASPEAARVLVWEVGEDAVDLFCEFDRHQGSTALVQFGTDLGDPRVLSAGADGALVWPIDPLPVAVLRKPRELDEWELDHERFLATGKK